MLHPEPNPRPLYCVPDEPEHPRRERIAAWLLAAVLRRRSLAHWALDFAVVMTVYTALYVATGLLRSDLGWYLLGIPCFAYFTHSYRKDHPHEHHR